MSSAQLLCRIEVVWKRFNLQDVGRFAANGEPTQCKDT